MSSISRIFVLRSVSIELKGEEVCAKACGIKICLMWLPETHELFSRISIQCRGRGGLHRSGIARSNEGVDSVVQEVLPLLPMYITTIDM